MLLTPKKISELIAKGEKQTLATQHYPSRGQSSVQELYQTKQGKFFLKKVSVRNHQECQINPLTGSIAEREYWAYSLAHALDLNVPELWLIDKNTTVQRWIDSPDARTFKTARSKMVLKPENIFECALFDWITGQADRHDANYLYDYVNSEIILIDSSHCFLEYSGSMPDYLSYFEAASENLNQSFNSQVKTKMEALLKKGVSDLIAFKKPKELEAFINRLHQALNCSSIQDILSLYRRNL